MDKSAKPSSIFIYLITIILSACSLIYELLIAQSIASLATNTVIWYSLTIGFYLGAMGVGALLCPFIYTKKSAWRALCEVEIILSVLGSVAVGVIYLAHMFMTYLWVRNAFFRGGGLFFIMILIMILSIGFLTGIELPLLIRIAKETQQDRKITNRVLGVDYLGALLGGVVFPLFLIPHYKLLTIGFGVALLNIMVAGSILFFIQQKKVFVKKIIFCFLWSSIIFGIWNVDHIQQYFLKKYYYYEKASQNLKTLFQLQPKDPKIERYHSPYQNIDIVSVSKIEEPFSLLINAYSQKFQNEPDCPRNKALFLDGSFQFWTNFEELYHEYFAHVPIIFNQQVPKKVLVLGGGDGLLLRELVKYSEIQTITHVDLDKEMIHLAKIHPLLKRMNKDVFKDARIHVIFHDAYHYLKESKDQFDAIYLDFPKAEDYRLSKLYSQEFFSFVRKHLTAKGYAVLDAPDVGSSEAVKFNNYDVIYRSTLKAAGFQTIIQYSTRLEIDNSQARSIFDEAIGNANEITVTEIGLGVVHTKRIVGRQAVITRLVQDFTGDYKQPFFLVTKNERIGIPQYKDLKIPLYILNEKRYYLAFEDQVLEQTSPQKINSIMLPTLPGLSMWWRLKLPY